MSKQATKKIESTPLPQPTGKFFTVAKESHLLYLAYEIDVRDGVVQSIKCISRAPDLAQSAVGHCSSGIWSALRNQPTEDMK